MCPVFRRSEGCRGAGDWLGESYMMHFWRYLKYKSQKEPGLGMQKPGLHSYSSCTLVLGADTSF